MRRWFIWRSNDSSYTIHRTRIDISVVVKEETCSILFPFELLQTIALCWKFYFSLADYGVQVCVKSIQRDAQTWCTLQLEGCYWLTPGPSFHSRTLLSTLQCLDTRIACLSQDRMLNPLPDFKRCVTECYVTDTTKKDNRRKTYSVFSCCWEGEKMQRRTRIPWHSWKSSQQRLRQRHSSEAW